MLSPLITATLALAASDPRIAAVSRELALAGLPPLPEVVASCPTVVVANCEDDGMGSLRQAIVDSCDGGTVDLRQLSCPTIALTSELAIPFSTFTLIGPGANKLSISGGSHSRVINHAGTGQLSIYDLTLTEGIKVSSGPVYGGCLYSEGSTLLAHSTVSSCLAHSLFDNAAGGGAMATKQFFLLYSTLADNTAAGANSFGGGAESKDIAAAFSTITNNFAAGSDSARGGGLFQESGGSLCTISNSLLVRNVASDSNGRGSGGGAELEAAAPTICAVKNSTFYQNKGYFSEQLFSQHAAIANSTLINDTSTNRASIELHSNSSIDSSTTNAYITFASDIMGGNNVLAFAAAPLHDTYIGDPQLGPLQANGGPTLSMLPLPGSPLIGHGSNPNGFTFDQRGAHYSRTAGSFTDIGAVQYDTIFADGLGD